MDFDVAIEYEPRHVRVTVKGVPALGELLSLIHLLGLESESWQQRMVLVDLRGVATAFSRSEQFRIGEEAATSLSHMDCIASLVPPQRLTRVSEKAARRHGTNVRVFADEREAIAWLEEEARVAAGPPSSGFKPESGSRD
jgi:hypothetical protein